LQPNDTNNESDDELSVSLWEKLFKFLRNKNSINEQEEDGSDEFFYKRKRMEQNDLKKRYRLGYYGKN
jgi:hypothetical protein